MARIITDLRDRFRRGDIVVRLIFINVAIFLIVSLAGVFVRLMGSNADSAFSFLAFPASLDRFAKQPWTIITYMFMHGGVWHILFNMLCLYWFGEIFLRLFSTKHLQGLYVLGGIFGALLFMLCYNVFPYFAPVVSYATVVGASASILAIIIASAYRDPDYKIPLLFLGNISLKYLALITIAVDVLFITSENAGGHIAHLGGVLAGLAFAVCLRHGLDLTVWINAVIDFFTGLFDRKTWHRKPKMKVHYNTARRETDAEYNMHKKQRDDEIDRILDKLKKSGYESLSTEEKKRLFDASKR